MSVAPGRRIAGTLPSRVRSPLVVSSLYLMAGPIASSGLGFLFWFLAARSTDSAAIGLAAAAVAAVNLLIAVTELGFGTAVIHYAPSAGARAPALVNAFVRPSWLAIVAGSAVFMVGLPLWSPGLLPITDSLLLAAMFVTYAAFNHILGLQDASMIASGDSRYVFLRSVACNVPSVMLLVPLVSLLGGVTGLFVAYALPNVVVGAVVGLLVLPRRFPGYRFFGSWDLGQLRSIAPYGLANHAGNILWSVPVYVLPMIAVNALSAEDAGRFYIVWAVASLLLVAPRMITYAMFAESSRALARLRPLTIETGAIVAALTGPSVVILWFAGAAVLGLFGSEYANERLLRILLLSVVPFSLNSIWFVILRVRRQLRQIVVFAGFTSAWIVVLSGLLAAQLGLDGLAFGWLAGQLIGSLLAVAGMARLVLATR